MTRTPLDILRTVYGYDTFRGRQAEVIDHLLAGGDALLLAPTGGGKSLCYQIPALLRDGTGHGGFAPDRPDAGPGGGPAAAGRAGGFPQFDPLAAGAEARSHAQLRGGELDLLYLAPERLRPGGHPGPAGRRRARRSSPSTRPTASASGDTTSARSICSWTSWPTASPACRAWPAPPRPTTAPATRSSTNLRLDGGRIFVTGFDRPNIRYLVTERSGGTAQVLRFLRNEHPGEAGIVYCLSRKKTEQVAATWRQAGLTALPYHAGLPDRVRAPNTSGASCTRTAWSSWPPSPSAWASTSRTCASSSTWTCPAGLEAYYQETGRAGRDGLPATALLTYGLQDVVLRRRMLEDSEADDLHKRIERQRLEAMLGYCEVVTCRRQALLRPFRRRPARALRQLRHLPLSAGDLRRHRGGPEAAVLRRAHGPALRRQLRDRRSAGQRQRADFSLRARPAEHLRHRHRTGPQRVARGAAPVDGSGFSGHRYRRASVL